MLICRRYPTRRERDGVEGGNHRILSRKDKVGGTGRRGGGGWRTSVRYHGHPMEHQRRPAEAMAMLPHPRRLHDWSLKSCFLVNSSSILKDTYDISFQPSTERDSIFFGATKVLGKWAEERKEDGGRR